MLQAASALEAQERLAAIEDAMAAAGNLKDGRLRSHLRDLGERARGRSIFVEERDDAGSAERGDSTSVTREMRSFGFEVERV